MTPVEALELALSKEIEAMELYKKFSGEYTTAKDIFVFLTNEEYKHKQLIENKIVELTK